MSDFIHNGASGGENAPVTGPVTVSDGTDPDTKAVVAQSVETGQTTTISSGEGRAKGNEPASIAPVLDPADDSEAETVLSSPVKKREALKKAQGLKVDNVSQTLPTETRGERQLCATPAVVEPGPAREHRQSSTGPDNGSAVDASAPPAPSRPVRHSRNSSMSSRTSRDQISPDKGAPPPVTAAASDHDASQSVNPRKRKFRESSVNGSKQVGLDPKHQRRESLAASESEDRKIACRSPSAKAFKQSSPSDKPGEVLDGSDPNRKRRAASHRPGRSESKNAVNVWGDSDESSNGGDPPLSASAPAPRALNRSASTPGRPAGRDHKRHVNRYGFTRLAEGCESGDLAAVREWRERDPEQLNLREFAGNTPLQIASLNGCTDIVQYLISQGCDRHCANTDNDTPLIDAVENGHADTVKVLLDAGVNPLWQNLKGQQALDLISEDTENGPEMRAMLRKAIESWKDQGDTAMSPQTEEPSYRPGPKQGLQFLARTPENLLKLVIDNDRNGVLEFLDARVPVDNNIVAAAAKTGDLTLLNILLAEMSPRKAKSKAEKPMLAVIGTSHFDMVKALTDLDQFDPTWRSKSTGMTWYELAEYRQGPRWKEEKELLFRLYQDAPEREAAKPAHTSPGRQRNEQHKKSGNGQDWSEHDTEGSVSPDRARNRRRLISRRELAANSHRHSRSASPAGSTASARSESQSTNVTAESKPKRKPGRPRTKSLTSSQPLVPEQKIKRIGSGSIKDRPALFDMPTQNSIPKRAKPDDDRKASGPQGQSVLQEKLKRETEQQERLEEERRQAAAEEAARRAEEEAARSELVRQEALLREKQRRQEELLVKRQKYCDTLPSALRYLHTPRSPPWNPHTEAEYIKAHFLPLLAVPAKRIGFTTVAEESLFVSSYQVAGLLSPDTAMQALGQDTQEESTVASGETTSFYDGSKNPQIVPMHRPGLHAAIGSERFIHDIDAHRPPESEWPTDFEEECKIWRNLQSVYAADRTKFIAMSGLRWVPLDDVQDLLEIDFARSEPDVQGNGQATGMRVSHQRAVWGRIDPAGELDDRYRLRPSHYKTVKLWLPLPANKALPLTDQPAAPPTSSVPASAAAVPDATENADLVMSDVTTGPDGSDSKPEPTDGMSDSKTEQKAERESGVKVKATTWSYHSSDELVGALPVTDVEVVNDWEVDEIGHVSQRDSVAAPPSGQFNGLSLTGSLDTDNREGDGDGDSGGH